MSAQIIAVDGTVTATAPENGTDFSLEEMQKIAGGYIQIIEIEDGRLMVLNEEGKLEGLPVNDAATKLAKSVLMEDDYINGQVLVCGPDQVQ